MSKITLQCVKEKSKLRIKFHSFTDVVGKIYTNVYNNALNCKFPKDIRQEGYFYEIGPNDLSLVSRPGTKAFYQINTNSIKIVPIINWTDFKVYEITECVVCMADESSQIMAPCGHRCMCKSCCDHLLKINKKCPICRREIIQVLENIPE
jgi:hypothetical protein